MQEPANWNPALLSTMTSHTSCQRPGSETNHLVIPAVEHDAPGFPCKWQDCRSTTCFRREVDLMRHVKSVHVAPKAYCCLEPNCGKAFGRKDHLQNHKRNRHPDNH
ncbi:hypothetical protein BDW59DRAFT_153235 [Aspergillus cavernicola]|uniref:C2H2-type domain-containing protein n=1 Tax=Aspergillus cavernicola TaxID=176166 RepID=A0ABR4HM81_9EURO